MKKESKKIGLLKQLENINKSQYRSHVEEVIESFGFEVVIIDYLDMVDLDELKNKSDDGIECYIYEKLKFFLKENDIRKIILAGDNFNYNVEPYHPEPRIRPRITKIINDISRECDLKIFVAFMHQK